jgi:hypothetical protein
MINCAEGWISICPRAPEVSSPFPTLSSCFYHRADSRRSAYPLLSGLCDVLVGLEETTDVQGLAAPDVAVDGPVEGKLQGLAVERAGQVIRGMSHARALGRLVLTGSGVWRPWSERCWPSRPANWFRGETAPWVSIYCIPAGAW